MDIFKDLITCQLCNNRMSDPRCLPCLHAFCLVCLQKRHLVSIKGEPDSAAGPAESVCSAPADYFQCPTCLVRFKDLMIEQLPQDFKIVQIIETLQQKELNDSLSCFEHKKKLELFCCAPNCLTPICYKCSITSHHNHEVAELADHYKMLLEKLGEAERQGQETVDSFNMYRSKEVRYRTLGDKLKQLVDNKVKCMILEENLKASGPVGVEMSPENGTINMLNRLQHRLLEIKQRIGEEGCNGFMFSSPVHMRDLHESVVRIITEVNNECYNALTSIKARQMSAVDVPSFSLVVRDLLKDGFCGEYDDPKATIVVQTEVAPPAVELSPAGSRKSLESDSGLLEGYNSRCDDVTSVVSSNAAGSDLLLAAMSTALEETVSDCSSSKDSPIRRPVAVPVHHVNHHHNLLMNTNLHNHQNNMQAQSSYSEVRNNAVVILRFQVVNPTFDKFTDIRDCALMGDDFVVIDKRNEWIKSFDVTNGRYIGTNNKGFTSAPVGVHSLTHLTMLLVEQTEEGFCELYFVNKDLTEKSPFHPELPMNEWIHDVCTSPTGQIILSTKSMNVYEQHAITSEFGTRMSKWRETRFNLLFNANFMISHMAVSATGFIALGNSEDNLIYLYDRNGRHKWKFPIRENTSFKRLKQINFDLAGNLITVDNYYQQVQVISRQGKLIRVLHGRALQFARPICAVPRGDNQIVVMSEFGSVVNIEKYL